MMRWVGGLLASIAVMAACSADDAPSPGAPSPATATADGGGGAIDRGPTPKASSGGPPEGDAGPVVVAAEPAIAYVGRFLVDGEARTVGWPGSRIVARFEGPSVAVKLSETSLYEGPSVFDVTVDDRTQKLTLAEGEKVYELARDLPAGPHRVELFRRTEGQVGRTIFRGFDFGTGKLLPPPAPRARRIEFLGDSGSTGYGVECTAPDGSFSAATQNFAKAWPTKVGELLDADVIGIGYAGKGIVQNFDRADPVHFEDIFVRTAPESPEPKWDFAKAPVDAVVIMLGGNDYDQPAPPQNDAPPLPVFKAGYAKLVGLAREKYPTALLVSVLAPTQSDTYPEGYEARTSQRKAFSEVVAERTAAGDPNVRFVEVAKSTDAEQTGCEFHPNEALHARIAGAIAETIRSAKSW